MTLTVPCVRWWGSHRRPSARSSGTVTRSWTRSTLARSTTWWFVLEAIFEEDFLGFSYGFRPGRGQHDALDALHAGIYRKRVNWVLDADIQGFFDAMSH
jgi:hypothetical protein